MSDLNNVVVVDDAPTAVQKSNLSKNADFAIEYMACVVDGELETKFTDSGKIIVDITYDEMADLLGIEGQGNKTPGQVCSQRRSQAAAFLKNPKKSHIKGLLEDTFKNYADGSPTGIPLMCPCKSEGKGRKATKDTTPHLNAALAAIRAKYGK